MTSHFCLAEELHETVRYVFRDIHTHTHTQHISRYAHIPATRDHAVVPRRKESTDFVGLGCPQKRTQAGKRKGKKRKKQRERTGMKGKTKRALQLSYIPAAGMYGFFDGADYTQPCLRRSMTHSPKRNNKQEEKQLSLSLSLYGPMH